MNNIAPMIEVCREGAEIPTKAHPTDIGFDLTAIDIKKDFGEVKLYGTGIKITPHTNYYIEIVPRSSISKSGYMLANSVGIIDPTYTGELLIALRKVDKDAPDLVLPNKIAQLIFRLVPWVPDFKIVEKLEDTDRGEGGFGSTDKKGNE